MIGAVLWAMDVATRELLLFAGVGRLIGGIDDLAVDLIWIGRSLWRRATIYRQYPRATLATLSPPVRPGRIAILIGAWAEGEVIGAMLEAALRRIGHGNYRIYVGMYANDPDTLQAVGEIVRRDARVRPVVGDVNGPTTKAECLNWVWAALVGDEQRDGVNYKAIVLHDAEDVVHPAELALFDRMIERFDMVQLPVLPLVDPHSRWIGGHYCDEFAEAHGRQLVVREALGAGVPSAGVGCAISREAMERFAAAGRSQREIIRYPWNVG
jgi:adsorption protein B